MEGTEHVLAFEPLDDPPGIEIVDRIERDRCILHTDRPVSPEPAATDDFQFPVDRAVRITARRISLTTSNGAHVRDASGAIVAKVEFLGEESLPPGEYSIELFEQFKTYVEVESAIEISGRGIERVIDFGSPTELVVGSLSQHERPAATVTTTRDPVDMMAAVETFGSALKTASPDRSFPSLRGHPPAVELGDRLDIPSSVAPRETGIRLELPPERDAIYAAAPLAYYLGAEILPGPVPKLTTDAGFEQVLSTPHGFEYAVERTLKQVFFLDCVTRTEGLYEISLHERNQIEPLVDLDFETLYHRPLPEQVAAYLDVPYEVIDDHVPEWRLTVHVEPAPETVEQLPFVVDDLAVVRTYSRRQPTTSPSDSGRYEDAGEQVLTRSAGGATTGTRNRYVEPEASGSLEQAWIGDSIPIGASKLTKEAFENRLDRTVSGDDISISIVLNDPRMDEERDIVDRVYGSRENLDFDVNVFREVSTEELRGLLEADTGFLHYIGHTEHDGFECPDGKLDVRDLERTGVEAFMLNACNSYNQGLGLIEAGAIGGIVTLNDVINTGAVRIGESIARLLNGGFPLRAAMTIARGESVLGGQYIVVGDGGMTVAQPASGTPNLLKVTPESDGFTVEIETFATDVAGLGSVYKPHIGQNDEFYLSSGSIQTFHVSTDELGQFLALEDVPIRADGDLHWSSTLDVAQLEEPWSSL